ncbi:DUF2911 domain-containing protein [Muriicola sp.]|uniref:DUF2911 domain-containing protein n=1 Tax=Muriicola sp. TaxID=2020856 RepID=UPI003569FADA
MRSYCGIGTFVLLLFSATISGQIRHPRASPSSSVSQDIGLTTITVEYSRPAVRGRQVFGGLVPYGRIWRVGANESTKFTTNTEVSILGNTLEPGTYALYAFPEEATWEVAFHRNTSHWGDGRTAYDPSEDVFRIEVTPRNEAEWQENFLISFDSIHHNGARMNWKWGYTAVNIPLEVDTRKTMLDTIGISLEEDPTAQTYYEAARYLQEEGLESEKALEYVEKAIDLGGDTYYFYRVRSLLQASLGDYKGAISSAERSLQLAEAEGKDEFVRMNRENVKKWKKWEKENR